MRTYELAIVFDPRITDEEYASLVDEYKAMVTANGAELAKEESWGKRKLAYPINKLHEGRYVFLYIVAQDDQLPKWTEIELRLRQSDKVLRFLTVRTDEDLLRAVRKGRKAVPAAQAVGLQGEVEDSPEVEL